MADQQPVSWLDCLKRDLLKPSAGIAHRRARDSGQERGHFSIGAALGKALEILPARVHQSDHQGGKMLAEEQGCAHREGGDDVEPNLATPEAGDDLQQERQENRKGCGRPDRT